MHPELGYDVHRTVGVVSQNLKEFGCEEVATGIGRTGVVGFIKGRREGRTIGLRADMDALPIREVRDLPYKSRTPGTMHACGHDGHTAMLLGAAKYLAATRDFSGNVAVIFQPAEETGAGGMEMVNDGMMDRFAINEVYGMHNMPGLAVGKFSLCPGPIMAAADVIKIEVEGLGGHAANPHNCADPTLAGAAIVQALQSIASRNVDPLESAVVSITTFHADGGAVSVIPTTVELAGTARSLSPKVRDMIEQRVTEIVPAIAAGYGCRATAIVNRGYPVTVNHAEQATFARRVAEELVGEENVDGSVAPLMAGEDFSYMLEARPGAFIFYGNGNSAGLHHPEYDFNDDSIPFGCSMFVKLVETALRV